MTRWAMLDLVDTGEHLIAAYRGVAPDALLDDLAREAAPLEGARVLHLNATPYGGGVSELLRSVVPLLNDLGLVADWRIISGDERFFEVTKALHNGLQGAPRVLSEPEQATYLANSRLNANAFEEDYDFVFLHDPQPAAILSMRGKGRARWIWRCHIDTSHPNPQVWQFLEPFLRDYDAAVFTMEDFVPPGFPVATVEIIPPAIDPENPKNIGLPDRVAREVLEWLGLDLRRPLVTQVSRFDPWKDPLGVIQAYRLARREVPELRLVLAGSLALDDPEGWGMYRTIQAEVRGDPSINVFTNIVGVGNIEVNALQARSNLVIQKSLREGFGLVISEALWKGTPVVAGRAGGIPLQMADGVGGLLVDSVEECAAGMVRLLRDPEQARELGRLGKERVREHFLIPRLLLNEVRLMNQLSRGTPLARPADWLNRDPVCGMAVGAPPAVSEGTHRFCSQQCRARFLREPSRYL